MAARLIPRHTNIPFALDESENEYETYDEFDIYSGNQNIQDEICLYSDSDRESFYSGHEDYNSRSSDDAQKLIEESIEDKQNDTRSCANCSKKKRVEYASCLTKGQHISISGQRATFFIQSLQKQVKFYSHHAIVKQVVACSKEKVKLVLIHFQTNDKGVIAIDETEETFNLQFDELYIVDYQHPAYSSDEIVRRAEAEKDKKQKYNLLSNNCEHFATWCVVGKGKSFQVQGAFSIFENAVFSMLGEGSKIANFILRTSRPVMQLVLVSADEIATGVSTAAGHITLGVTAGAYLIYCIVMTAYYVKQYRKDRTMCRSCLKVKLLDMWLRFSIFGLTSVITYLIIHFALPIINPLIGIPLLGILLLLSTAVIWVVPYIRKKFQSPLQLEEQNEISDLSELHRGDIVNFKYYKLQHCFIVTDLKQDTSTRGKLKCIHYSLPGLLSTRVVAEEVFDVDLNRQSVKLLDCGQLNTFSGEVVVHRARKRVGEKKWSVSNRSDHLCHWAKTDLRQEQIVDCLLKECEIGESKANTLSSLDIETKEVHLMEEIQPGDVVQLKGDGPDHDKGILVSLTHIWNGRKFEMEIIMPKTGGVSLVEKTVDLDTDKLFVRRYHPARCHPMKERVRIAYDMYCTGSNWRWTQLGFIEVCIMKNC